MNKFQKFRVAHLLKIVPLLRAKASSGGTLLYVNCSYHFSQHIRLCSTETAFTSSRNGGGSSSSSTSLCELAKKSRTVRKEAQAALSEYFHSTRSLQIMDAENMSKNTPEFFDRLLQRVEIGDAKVGRALTRFLRYHPVNEFEPFFESIGLTPCDYSSFLPRNLMFLSDDQLLLENYYVLCNYGVPRNRIGKIYKEVTEVFGYKYGVLHSKLQSLQDLGLNQSLVVKIVASSPGLLRGDDYHEFVHVLEKLRRAGIEYDWFEEHLSVEDSYNWKCLLELIHLFADLDLSEKQLGEIFSQHPDLLLECSGRITFRLLGFLLKFGSTMTDVKTTFLHFPQISVVKFVNNLCNCYRFLVEVNMAAEDIGWIVRSHPTMLGSCELKKVKSLLSSLNCGKSRICQMVKDDPCVLEKWVLGVRVNPLQEEKRVVKVRMVKTEFLLSLGFVEKSNDMEKALKVFRGKGIELQERFDCFVNAGFSREEVIQMFKMSPQMLNQSRDVIESKIGLFVKDLGYTIKDLLSYPKLISYTIERLKLRLLMYKWLKGEGALRQTLALSTLLSSSDEEFVRMYVKSHPRGPQYWKRLKKQICPE